MPDQVSNTNQNSEAIPPMPLTGIGSAALVRNRATNKSVRDLPVKATLKLGRIIVEQKDCGITFSFPAGAWPQGSWNQAQWVERLTPWWDIGSPDWTAQCQRLRDACRGAINSVLNFRAVQSDGKGARELKASPDTGGAARLEACRVADCIPNDGTQRRRDADAPIATETRTRRSLEQVVGTLAKEWAAIARELKEDLTQMPDAVRHGRNAEIRVCEHHSKQLRKALRKCSNDRAEEHCPVSGAPQRKETNQ